MKNVKSSQPCISMNFCTEFGKPQVIPCEYHQSTFYQQNLKLFLKALDQLNPNLLH